MSEKPDPEWLIERLQEAVIAIFERRQSAQLPTLDEAQELGQATGDLLASQQAELQRVKEEGLKARRGLAAAFHAEADKREAAEAALREAVGVLEPFAKADLHAWSGRGAVAPFIDRSHFEAAAALRSRLTQHTPQTEEGEP